MIALALLLSLAVTDATPLVHGGQLGVWLPIEDAREANSCLERAPMLATKLRLLTESDTLATQEIVALRVALSDSRAQGDVLQEQLERSIERQNSVLRSPALWYSLGIVTALVGVLVVATQ